MSYHHEQLDGVLEDFVSSVASRQFDVLIDAASDRFSKYLDSPKGEALMQKIETRAEETSLRLLYKHKWSLALLGIGAVSLTTVGVSLGAKLGPKGTQLAAVIGFAALFPLLLRSPEQVAASPSPLPPPPKLPAPPPPTRRS